MATAAATLSWLAAAADGRTTLDAGRAAVLAALPLLVYRRYALYEREGVFDAAASPTLLGLASGPWIAENLLALLLMAAQAAQLAGRLLLGGGASARAVPGVPPLWLAVASLAATVRVRVT